MIRTLQRVSRDTRRKACFATNAASGGRWPRACSSPPAVAAGPDRLATYGIAGPAVGRLQREGSIEVGGRTVTADEVSQARPGQRFGFVMDTRLCDGVFAVAEGVDLLVIESTFADGDADLAWRYGH